MGKLLHQFSFVSCAFVRFRNAVNITTKAPPIQLFVVYEIEYRYIGLVVRALVGYTAGVIHDSMS